MKKALAIIAIFDAISNINTALCIGLSEEQKAYLSKNSGAYIQAYNKDGVKA